jgi:hypothetical protein
MTPKAQHKALERERRRYEREMAKATLRELREHLKMARAAHRGRVSEVRSACRADKLAVRERVRAMRHVARLELAVAVRDERAGAVQACQIRHEQARAEVRTPAEKLREEKRYQAELRRIERLYIQKRREVKRATTKERRSESDDEVRGNIPPEYVGLFERVKGKIRGGERKSRTEAFMQYVEEHPAEFLEVLEDRSDLLVRELERQEREHRRLAKARPRRRRDAEIVAAAAGAEEVPF